MFEQEVNQEGKELLDHQLPIILDLNLDLESGQRSGPGFHDDKSGVI